MITNLTTFKRVFPSVFVSHQLLILLFILPASVVAQLEVDFTTTVNTNCAGTECDYDGPGILINEIMLSPLTNDGSLWGGLATQSGEWIELYNPDFCNEVDISCYYLGNSANDPVAYPGGYVIPPGTVVPPAGFVLIRGINAAPVNPNLLIENGGNTIELVVTGEGVCVGGGSRLWFPNAGGWFAFYDSFGIPQDAVTWANQSNQGNFACVPPIDGCNFQGQLPNYFEIPDDRKEVILTQSAAVFQGQSIRRLPDGGAWDGPGPPTYGTCNADCVNVGTSSCNGTATAIPAGGQAPFSYFWNDAQFQTTQTAEGLCAGLYCVIIVDALNEVSEQCVIVEEASYDTDTAAVFCSNVGYTLPDNTVINEAGVYELILQTAGGCDSLVTLELDALPNYSFDLGAEICSNQNYILPDSTVVTEPGTYVLNFETIAGCDSIYTVNLEVVSILTISQNVVFCEGESFVLPDETVVEESGNYEVIIQGELCDTIFLFSVEVTPVYDVDIEVSICQGESHMLPDGEIVDETGVYTTMLQTAAGCDSTIQTLLMVNPPPPLSIPIADVYCYLHGMVNVNPVPSGGNLSGSFVSGTILDLTFAPPGEYSISYAYTDNNGCSNFIEQEYAVLPEVVPDYTYQASCFNTAEFTNLTPDPEMSLSFVWLIEDDEFSTAFSPTYLYSEFGEFFVTLIATNSANCSYSYTQEVTFEEGLQLSLYQIPNVITPNGDGINDRLGLMPAEDKCLNYKITIFNRWGLKVYEMTETSVPFAGRDSNGNNLGDGVYFYIFESPQIDCDNILFEQLCNGSITVLR